MIEQTIIATDGHKIQTYIWPNEHAKAWVHILHGMAEHVMRYDDFAQSLVAAGYSVVAHNHRGHGSGEGTILGQYSDQVNWQNFIQDITSVRGEICSDDRPYFVFGHSMGSFITQSYLVTQPKDIAGVILSGSNYAAVVTSKFARLVAKIERFRVGRQNSSGVLQFITFGSFNQKFKPNRTICDWLSRDPDQVDKYIADPLSGATSSSAFWHDFFDSFVELFTPANFKKINADIPLYIMGGTHDPVGEMGKGLPNLYNAYIANGQKDVSLKLYENGRHEMLNEINKDEVTANIINWLQAHN
ncbi:MAG: alpha/beta hydrolase [Hyphomicrobiales bacterium]